MINVIVPIILWENTSNTTAIMIQTIKYRL